MRVNDRLETGRNPASVIRFSAGPNHGVELVDFSPAQVPANGSATVQFQVPLRFSRVDACSGISGVSQLNGQVTIVTSAGTFSAQTTNSLSLVYP